MLEKLLDRPVTVTMVSLVAVVLGVVSLRLLPVSLVPDVDIPYITVQVSAPDMSAREIDESVVRPLQRQLLQINGLSDIVCLSNDGSGMLKLSFDYGVDTDYLFVDVNERVDRAMSSLPQIERPRVIKSESTDIPAFYINITGEGESFSDLSRFVRDVICRRVEQLPEVAMVDVSGYSEDEIIIIPDRGKLAQMGISQDGFEKIIRGANIRLGSLSLRDGQYRYSVKFLSDVSNVSDIGNIWLRSGDRVLQVKDIASVEQRPSPRTGLVRSDGKDAVCLAVIKQSGARMSALKHSVSELTAQLSEDYPQLDFLVTRDQTKLLDYSINNLVKNIILGLVLACIVIFLFMMDFKSPSLVSLTMPLALILSMAVFYVAGLSLNIISLAGLLLGVGMMADNTIILVDNITSRWQGGMPLRDAVLRGTKEVAGPMFSSMLTTCAVFIPLVFVSGIAGALFYDQAMSVTIVLLTSYLVTVTVIPVYYFLWYRRDGSFRPVKLLSRISVHERLLRAEDRIVGWFIRHSAAAWGLLALSLVGAVLCFWFMPKSRLPEITSDETIVSIDWNGQLSLEENVTRVSALEAALSGLSSQVTSFVGEQQFVLSHSGDAGISEASVYVKCASPGQLSEAQEAVSDFMRGYPSAVWSLNVAGNIFDMVFGADEAPLVAKLRPVSSPEIEPERLETAVSDLRTAFPGLRIDDIPMKTDILFVAEPELMALYGVSTSELVSAQKNALNGNRLFTIVQGSRSVPVVSGTEGEDLWTKLGETYINNVPVTDLLRRTQVRDLKTLVSGKEGSICPVPLDVRDSDVPAAVSKVRGVLAGRGDFDASFSGEWFSSRKMAGEMAVIFIVAVLILYLILASQFESLLQPLLIMAEIVVDVFAALLTLWACGVTINLMSLIGLVVVSGIVINDSILKVDTINRLRKDGVPLTEAVMKAGAMRMKAIIMTSLTTVLAVAPFLSRGNMGDDLQFPMSIVIISGMTVGTLVSLFVLPALYHSVYRRREEKRGADVETFQNQSCS